MKKRIFATLTYDDESGELGTMTFSKDFLAESDLLQADVLQDVKDQIEGQYEVAKRKAFPNAEPTH